MFEVNETFGGGGMISYYDTSNSPHVYSMNVNDEERVRNNNKLLFSLPNKFIEEDEYRLIKGGLTKRNIPIPKEAIQEIFLGENCTEQDSTEIIEAVKENLPHIKIVKRAKFEDLGYYIFKDEVLL
jgi:hypothetical protein